MFVYGLIFFLRIRQNFLIFPKITLYGFNPFWFIETYFVSQLLLNFYKYSPCAFEKKKSTLQLVGVVCYISTHAQRQIFKNHIVKIFYIFTDSFVSIVSVTERGILKSLIMVWTHLLFLKFCQFIIYMF